MIIDTFCFFNELDILEIRLSELYPYVDRIILCESSFTHSGQSKPLYFEENKDRFAKYLDKITHVIVKEFPKTEDPWIREHYQRDIMINILNEKCKNDDIIIVSDLDEIPRGDKIAPVITPKFFEQNQYSYYLNYNVGISPIGPGTFSRITSYKWLKESKLSLTGLRYHPLTNDDKIADGGWHFSWMGGGKNIAKKLESWAHQEFNKPENLQPEKIDGFIKEGKEHLGREMVGETKKVIIDNTFPQFVVNNQEYLIKKGLLDIPKVAIIMPYYNDKTFITKSVGAILNQTFQNWELFIVDDGSDMDKRAINILAAHPKIHHCGIPNSGPAAARNYGLDIINKDDSFTYIAFCDSDDIWMEDFLVSNLATIGDNDIVYSSVNEVFEDGQRAYPYGIPDPEEYPGKEVMLATPFIYISSVLCRKECLSLLRFDSELDSIEDWSMWLTLDEKGYKFKKNNQKLVTYTVKENGMAGKRTEDKSKLLRKKHTYESTY
jgi:beta-1,4-mannosyl-glycoprotein beta-1,4-N-acetylglucosaminyltransferase